MMGCKHNFLGESVCEHCGACEGSILRAERDAAIARAERVNAELAALRDQVECGGCAVARLGERTYECRVDEPCGLCRLRARAERAEAERDEAIVCRRDMRVGREADDLAWRKRWEQERARAERAEAAVSEAAELAAAAERASYDGESQAAHERAMATGRLRERAQRAEAEVARLTRELTEARDEQSASAHDLLVAELDRLRKEAARLRADPRVQVPLDGPGSHRWDLAEQHALRAELDRLRTVVEAAREAARRLRACNGSVDAISQAWVLDRLEERLDALDEVDT